MTISSKTIQLRRYRLDPSRLDEFGPGWASRIAPLRRKYGFEVEFAYLDRDRSEFIWAVSTAGDRKDFLDREADYYGSSEKAPGTPPDRKGLVIHSEVTFLEPVGY